MTNITGNIDAAFTVDPKIDLHEDPIRTSDSGQPCAEGVCERLIHARVSLGYLEILLRDELEEMSASRSFQKLPWAPDLEGRLEMAQYLLHSAQRELEQPC